MTKTLTKAAVAYATLLATSGAWAQGTPTTIRLTDGLNAGPIGENTGPGAEQATVTRLVKDNKTYVQIVWMSSQVPEGDRPYQCKCTSIEMDPLQGPKVISADVQITANDGDRPCNHPKTSAIGADKTLLVYGTNDPNQANVQTYAEVLNHDCTRATRERLRISNNNNTNEGAPDVITNGMRNGKWIATAGYLSANNNGESRAVGLEIEVNGVQATITKTFDRNIVAPANIGRPSMQPVSTDRTLFCSSKGNNRPPEEGVACALVNTVDGSSVWTGMPNADRRGAVIIAASQPDATPRVYYNQPQVTVGENGRFYVQAERTNGRGRNNGNRTGRGSTTTYVYALEVTDQGPSIRAMESNLGSHQVHATICSGSYGADGALHSAIYEASVTGSGPATMQMVRFDPQARTVTRVGPVQAVGAYNADSGYLANLYGNNPNNQGRDFYRCLGDVPNPGFGQNEGFRPTVQSFFVMPFYGMVAGEPKNSLFVSFVPGSMPPAPQPVLNGLTVRVQGEGRVDSTPAAIDNCTAASCTAQLDSATTVTLTARPAAGSTFVGWMGSCTGAANCVLRMDVARDVTALFTKVGDPLPTQVPLSVNVSGQGSGTVSSQPAGITCSMASCVANYERGTTVTLTAQANDNSTFAGWIGDCSGTAACTVRLDAARAVSAVFEKKPTDPTQSPGPSPSADPLPTGSDPKVSACSTTGDSTGTLAPVLSALAAIVVIRRRRK